MNTKSRKVYAMAAFTVLLAAFAYVAVMEAAAAQTSNSTTTNSTSAAANTTASSANKTASAPTVNQTAGTSVSNSTTSTAAANVTSIMAQRLVGQISSVQLDNTTGKPAWIQSGVWLLRGITNSTGAQAIQLYARFEMIKPDGTAMHSHKVYAFRLAGQPTSGQDGSTVLNGTATVTMPGGPVKDVPTTIKIFNNKLIGIWIGPAMVNNHFGSGPIYGTVTKASLGVMSQMQSNSTQS